MVLYEYVQTFAINFYKVWELILPYIKHIAKFANLNKKLRNGNLIHDLGDFVNSVYNMFVLSQSNSFSSSFYLNL